MTKKLILVLTLSVAVIMILFAVSSWLSLRTYKRYVEDNPPTTIPKSEKCSASGLVGHWTFEGIVGETVPDLSGQKNDGTFRYWLNDVTKFLYGAPKVIQGKDEKGLEFKGRQWVDVGNNNCFITEQFTISAWVWQEKDDVLDPAIVKKYPGPYNVPTIMAKSSWPYDGWWLCSTTTSVDGKIHYRDIDVGIAYGNGFSHVKSGYQLPLREWHHIAVSMDNINQEAQFYIDGRIYGAKQKGVPKWFLNWNHDLFVGEYDGSGRWPWFGKLDDVRFYNKVVTDKEALELFSNHVNPAKDLKI